MCKVNKCYAYTMQSYSYTYINYCCFIWASGYVDYIKKLVILQKRAMRVIEGINLPHSANPVFKKYNILKVQDIAKLQMLLVLHKYLCNTIPLPVEKLFHTYVENHYGTRQDKHFEDTSSTKNYRLFTIACLGPKL